MNAEKIEFTTRAVEGQGRADSADTAWSAQVIAKRIVDEAEFCAAVAERTRQSAADEWVRLVDAEGTVVATGTILDNDAATLDCSFASMPPPGQYRVEVRARNGAASSFATEVVRKSVEGK